MAKLTYAIEQNGLKHLELTYKGFVYDGSYISVTLEDRELGAIPDKSALKAGQEFLLEDGTTVGVSYTKKNGIEVHYNGQRIIAFASHKDVHSHFVAYVVTFFNGYFSLLMAIIALSFGRLDIMSPFILYWLFAGGIFLVLGYFVKKGSVWALAIALLLYVADAVVLVMLPNLEHYWAASLLIYHLLLLYPLFRGIGAIARMTKEEENQPIKPLQ